MSFDLTVALPEGRPSADRWQAEVDRLGLSLRFEGLDGAGWVRAEGVEDGGFELHASADRLLFSAKGARGEQLAWVAAAAAASLVGSTVVDPQSGRELSCAEALMEAERSGARPAPVRPERLSHPELERYVLEQVPAATGVALWRYPTHLTVRIEGPMNLVGKASKLRERLPGELAERFATDRPYRIELLIR